MSDRIIIGYAPMADFSTAEYGVLKVVGGKVVFDKPKAFNRARRIVHAGASLFRILRRGLVAWGAQVPFDWEDAGYFDLFREYLAVLHQPYQNGGTGKGADVLVELFDGCSESWMYDSANYEKARSLMRRFFAELGHLPYVKFGCGNEMNQHEALPFMERVVFPEFKSAGRIPFSYGAMYSTTDDAVEDQKRAAEAAWDEETMCRIYRPVHHVRDASSVDLVETVDYWVINNNPIATMFGPDGVFDGASLCDRYGSSVRPSPEQMYEAVLYFLTRAKSFEFAGGQRKYVYEYLPKAVNQDDCFAQGVQAISHAYSTRFGHLPENYGKYPDDWKEPQPEPEPTPEPVPHPTTCKGKYITNRPVWKWQIGKFLRCWFRL